MEGAVSASTGGAAINARSVQGVSAFPYLSRREATQPSPGRGKHLDLDDRVTLRMTLWGDFDVRKGADQLSMRHDVLVN